MRNPLSARLIRASFYAAASVALGASAVYAQTLNASPTNPGNSANTGGATCTFGSNLTTALHCVTQYIDNFVYVVFAIAFIVFIWGVFQYFIAGGANDEKREQGKKFVLWGIIGFFVMISVWGIVNLLIGTFGFTSTSRPSLPTFNSTNSSATPTNPSPTGP